MMKYRNKKVVFDGIQWDSIKERDYYLQLCLRKRAKDIIDFKIKPKQILQEGFRIQGKAIQAITYTPDFVIYHTGKTEFVDVKGVRTESFNLKWKMLQYKYRADPNYIFSIV